MVLFCKFSGFVFVVVFSRSLFSRLKMSKDDQFHYLVFYDQFHFIVLFCFSYLTRSTIAQSTETFFLYKKNKKQTLQ